MPAKQMPVLPEEILELVFENLRYPEDRLYHGDHETFITTLCAICLSSKQCLRLARPILYRNVHFRAGPSPEECIRKFSQTVVQHSHLAKLVQEISFNDWGFDSQDDLDIEASLSPRHPPSNSLRSTYEGALGPLSRSPHPLSQTEFLEDVMTGTQDALIACILTQCSDLGRLNLVVPHGFDESWTHAILKLAGIVQMDSPSEVSVKALPHLREFRTEHWDTENATWITSISDVLRIPSLRKYHGFAVDLSIEGHPLEVRPFNLETLQLQWSISDANGLSRLLRCCQNLKHLSIEFGPSTVGDQNIRFDDFGDALRAHAKKLKSLVLDIEESDFNEMQEEDVIAPLGSLKSLDELEILRLPEVALWGGGDEDDAGSERMPNLIDILPASLRTLFIFGEPDSNEEEKTAQIEAAIDGMGNLRLVQFGRERFPKDENETEEIGAGNEDAER